MARNEQYGHESRCCFRSLGKSRGRPKGVVAVRVEELKFDVLWGDRLVRSVCSNARSDLISLV